VTREDARDGENRPVEPEGEQGGPTENEEGPLEPGGFLREGEDPFLLRSRVGKTESYSRQQGEPYATVSLVIRSDLSFVRRAPFRNSDRMDRDKRSRRRTVFPGSGRLQQYLGLYPRSPAASPAHIRYAQRIADLRENKCLSFTGR
jgi:hypothetical protein